MIDLHLLRTDPDAFRAAIAKKHGNQQLVSDLLELDEQYRALKTTTESMQSQLNAESAQMPSLEADARSVKQTELRELSGDIRAKTEELSQLETQIKVIHRQIPNLPAADVPEGESDKDNVVVRMEGEQPTFAFTPLSHEVLCEQLGLVDAERATKVAGSKFYYLKNELVILEQALLRYALDSLRAKGFTAMTVPHMAYADIFYGAGHFSAPEDATEGDAYQLERDGLYLAGTAEIGLIGYRSQEILAPEELPARYVGISPCYRREAGTYGKETRGLYRVHQFNKVEMVTLVRPDESEQEHAMLLGIAEELMQSLGLHYQVVLNCGGDLGHPQAKKWDIETWMPGMGKYGETCSCSNDTDFQARALQIRFRETAAAKPQFVHTLNSTAFSSARMLIAIIENYQTAGGTIRVPDVLVPYTGFSEIGV